MDNNVISIGSKDGQEVVIHIRKCTLWTAWGPRRSGSCQGRVGFSVFAGLAHSTAAPGGRESAEGLRADLALQR